MHRHLRRRVAQDRAYARQTNAVPQHSRGGRMTKHMSALVGALDARSSQGALHDAFHGDARQRTKRRRLGEEQPRSAQARPGPLQIGHDRIADLLCERKPFGAPRFSTNGKPTVSPVDIGDLEMRNFARPQTQTGKQEHNSPVAEAAFAITRGNRTARQTVTVWPPALRLLRRWNVSREHRRTHADCLYEDARVWHLREPQVLLSRWDRTSCHRWSTL